MKTKNHKGFTLIELLVVLAIITLIFSLILASMSTARKKARDSTRLQEFSEIRKALELFYNQYGMYPCGDDIIDLGGGIIIFDDWSQSCPFIDGTGQTNPKCPVPTDIPECDPPKIGLHSGGYLTSPWLQDPKEVPAYQTYIYRAPRNRQTYLLQTRLEYDTNKMENDGGLCDTRYEFGPGLRDPILTLPGDPWDILFGCN
ncbi:type II secretion system GspH family protein [Patescibacteria group bacterium]|nr:type II secretion system GspH family protein [Patescibacteria group bacterium]